MTVIFKVNCKYNKQGAWCTHKQVKKSFFGIGKRYCIEYLNKDKSCQFKEKLKKGPPPYVKLVINLNRKNENIT